MTFRVPHRAPKGSTYKDYLPDESFEYSQAYLTRKRRMLFLRGLIYPSPYPRPDPFGPTTICDDILALNKEDSKKPIILMIDSDGGRVDAGMNVYNYIKLSKAPITTIGHSISSIAVSIFIAGKERLLLPNSQIVLHLPKTVYEKVALDPEDMILQAKQLNAIKDMIVSCYIDCGATAGLEGKPREEVHAQILKDIDREFNLTAQEAIDYGLADRIVTQEDLFGG